MAVREQNIILEPMDLFIGLREKNTVTCVADVADSLDGLYFELGSAGSAVATHYVYSGTDPVVAGLTPIEYTIATGATASAVASAIHTAVDAVAEFNSKVSGSVVTIENASMGLGYAGAGDSTFTVANAVTGEIEDLGGTESVEFTPNISVVEVTADQLGAQVLDEIQNGNSVVVSTVLKEMTADRWSSIVGGMSGSEFTPAGGTKLVGYGESRRFSNMTSISKELLMKPSNSSDDLRNLTLWKCYAMPGAINFSGTDTQGLAVEFKVFRDTNRNTAVNVSCFGDHKQNTLI